MKYIINGIQQIGIGVTNAKEVFNWYRKKMGFDLLVFEDESTASLMTQYTDDQPMNRYALLSMNMLGGGGLEIWQFKERSPIAQKTDFMLGDLGINMMKLRTKDKTNHRTCAKDPWNNWTQFVKDDYVFCETDCKTGGVLGAVIGVSDMEKAMHFYQDLLGFDSVDSDEIGIFEELKDVPGGQSKFRRVLLSHNGRKVGGFGKLLGPCQLELLQVLDRAPNKVYDERLWGDLGFIHLCFDISGMDAMKKKSNKLGYPFTVDSANSFDMGKAAGRFGYIEDPDGTLIEIVETHRVPIFQPLGININLKKRNPEKPLPNWLVKTMKIHRKRKDLV